MWIFLVFGLLAPVGLIFGLLGYNFKLSLYGIETSEPLSFTGLGLIVLFLLKGMVSFGLLKERDWAITLGLVDAVLGIIACCFVMIYPLIYSELQVHMNFRLELIALFPYLLALMKIKPAWENLSDSSL